ncbi:hypothetical protein VTN49DRAFT_7956 [Thermomyces lanuginosus]|uniref:uncharacterized protein n=1 Tax=Thermomyces lanuginosus TaxID=5541 RepID=UPI003744273D
MQQVGSFSNLLLYHVAAVENVLVAFEIDLERQPLEVQQTKWKTTTGQLLARKTFHLSLPADRPNDPFAFPYRRSLTFRHRTVIHTIVFCVNVNKRVTDHTLHLEYDYTVDQLSVQKIHTEYSFNDEAILAYLTRNLIYLWMWNTNKLHVCNVATGTANPLQVQIQRSLSSWIHKQLWRKRLLWSPWKICDVFGGREIFGVANEMGVELWFFNPKSVPERGY